MVETDIADEVLRRNMEAFDAKAGWLSEHHHGKYVIFHDATFVGAFDTFDAAARAAIKGFGQGLCLIRQVGGSREFPMPASVAYRPVRATR